ncbi:preprotein translocase subunit YajC [Candidatus Steffania adelgidicola]|uniref:preprotein translocase subunit YajC n=1 Tax=Candidatus Steffania adelgidicola TaxID=1076626 RepID=UPI001D021B3B|nr:preprotein translocase subunit YajC [Candidatus Steffania adelgidicola]UDG79838.1 Sec translocon accessory complex subunit YajC [Candidatus Steffania adelgidicola]
MSFLISNAVASIDPPSQSSPYSMLVMLIFFGLIFYFIILRPQQKRALLHKTLISSISKGDEVLTTGGLVGSVKKVTDSGYIFIALNETNVVLIKRDFVAAVLPRGTIKAL